MTGRSVRQRLRAVLAAILLLGGVQFALKTAPARAAAPPELTAALGASPTYNGLQCWVGDGSGTPEVVTLGGTSAWETQQPNNVASYIYSKITDTAFPHPHSATVTVTYWDGDQSGFFGLQYASTTNTWASAGQVNFTGTDTWMTHTFDLYDADLNGQENNGASFRIADDNSPVGVAVSQVSLAVSDVPAPPTLGTETQLGNIFQPGQTPTFAFNTTSPSVRYQAYDYDNELVASGTSPASGGTGTITINGLADGNYTMVIVSDNGGTLSPPVLDAFGVMPAAQKPDSSSPFGTVIHIDQGQDPRFETLLSNVGISNFRGLQPLSGVMPNWSQIEPSKGVYDWTAMDKAMAELKTDGYSGSVGVSGQQPSFYSGSYQTDPTTLRAWVDINAAFFKRYANYLPYMMTEIANEPDINNWTAQQYFTVLKPFYTAVKAADPTLQVLGPTGPGQESWTQQLIDLGGLHYLDAWDIHPYPAVPEGSDTNITQLEQWLQQENGGKPFPIVVSETGWTVAPGSTTPGTATSRAQQAAYYARMNVLLLKAGVKHIWWYEGADEWGTYGLLDAQPTWGSADPANGGYGFYTPHPAYNVAGTVAGQLADATYTRTLNVLPKASQQPVQAYQFSRTQGGSVDVLWTTGASTNVQLPAAGPVKVVNAMGDTTTLRPFAGHVSLTLTADPVYVTGVVGAVVQSGGPFTISTPTTAATGDSVPVTLSVAKSFAGRATFVLNGKRYAVSARHPQTASVSTSTILGPQTVRAEVLVNGRQVGQVVASFQVTQPVSTTTDPKVLTVDPAQTEMDVTVRNNHASSPMTVTNLQWSLGSITGTVNTDTSIVPNTSHTFVITPPPLVRLNSVYPLRIVVQDDTGQAQSTTRTMDFAPVVSDSLGTDWTTDQLHSQPSVAVPDQTQWLGGTQPSDSGNVWWDWDSKNLYMTAQIKQAAFSEPDPIDSSWNDNNIQFAVSPDVPDGTATPGSVYTAFNVALTPDGPQVYRFESPLSTGVLSDANIRITRDDSTQLTTYYLALPWTDISSVSPTNTNFGLTWLTNVNLNDGRGRLGWFQWGSGFGNGRNPTQFNFAQLMPAAN